MNRRIANHPMDRAWGVVQGRIEVPQFLQERAQDAGRATYEAAAAREFVDDAVTWLPDASWHADAARLFPSNAVRALGFEPVAPDHRDTKVYSTYGTDSHVDDEGPVCVLVLANDGLKFKQGRHTHQTLVGEWFLFDDRQPHMVTPTKRSTSYVFVHVPLRATPSSD